jgi:hypothetical protein
MFWFIFLSIILMVIGRKVGWAISKGILYPAPTTVSLVLSACWGIAVGFAISGMIGALHPGPVLKWIMGFALGAYVAIPNFGLFSQGTIPDDVQPRHTMISNVPLVAYIVTEFATKSMR